MKRRCARARRKLLPPRTSADERKSMNLQNLKYETRNSIGYVTINRPDKLNALNSAVMAELREAFTAARDDLAARVVILTGAGEQAFVAGADIAELNQHDPVAAKEYTHRGQAVLD